MVLELHVWGPAFSLPSIDAQCLAAIAYLQQVVPRGEWHLIASSNPALSPTRKFHPDPEYIAALTNFQMSFPHFGTATSGLAGSGISFTTLHKYQPGTGY